MTQTPWRLAVAIAGLGLPSAAHAQGALLQASEKASVTQRIAGTDLTVRYYRPSVRGRDSVFGRQVTWDEVWTPGANYVTTLTTSRPIQLDGHPVAPGTYGIWIEVKRDADWIFHLHPDTTHYHVPPPGLETMTMTFPVTPRPADFRETLTWDFEHVRADGAQLQLRWDRTLVSIAVSVEPAVRTTIDPAAGRPYAGEWQSHYVSRDTTRTMPTFPIRIWYDEASHQLLGHQAYPTPADAFDFVLIPRAEGIFLMGFMMNGELAEADSTYYMEFTFENGRPVRWVGRDSDDRIFVRGERADAAPAAPERRRGARP